MSSTTSTGRQSPLFRMQSSVTLLLLGPQLADALGSCEGRSSFVSFPGHVFCLPYPILLCFLSCECTFLYLFLCLPGFSFSPAVKETPPFVRLQCSLVLSSSFPFQSAITATEMMHKHQPNLTAYIFALFRFSASLFRVRPLA